MQAVSKEHQDIIGILRKSDVITALVLPLIEDDMLVTPDEARLTATQLWHKSRTILVKAGKQLRSPGASTTDLPLESPERPTSSHPPPSLSRPQDESYITSLAAELFSIIAKSCGSDRLTLKRISEMLPGLLRSFALKVGYRAQTPMQRDVYYFVHKNCLYIDQPKSFWIITDFDSRRIQAAFEEMFPFDDIAPEVLYSDVKRMQLRQYSIDRFLQETDSHLGQQIPEQDMINDVIEDDIESRPDNSYLDFILKTPAYEWLVATLQREVTLKRTTPDLMENIGRKILSALPSDDKVSRKIPSREYKARFELDWNPLSFVKEQQYTEAAHEALNRAITLTGCANDAQALTTGDYLSQTWPATGNCVMELVSDVVRNSIDHHTSGKYSLHFFLLL